MWYALTIVWLLLPQVFMFYFPALTPANTVKAVKVVADVENGNKAVPKAVPVTNTNAYSRHSTGHLKM
jgi:hypothetical protein